MRVTSIEVQNILGVKHARIDMETPVALVCGDNGAGKSSVLQAVRLAILGEMSRVNLKKDIAKMLHGDAARGMAAVYVGDFPEPMAQYGIPSAKHVVIPTDTFEFDPAMKAVLPYCLDPIRLLNLDSVAMRSLLMGVTGVRATPDDVSRRMIERGRDPAAVKAIAPMLRASFAEAAKDASRRATEARGAWKAVTGETYGSIKAANWTPADGAPLDADAWGKRQARREALVKAVAENVRESEAIQAKRLAFAGAAGRWDKRDADIRDHDAKGAMLPRILTRKAENEKSLAEAEAHLAKLRADAGQTPPKALKCPCCGEALMQTSDGGLSPYMTAKHDPEAAAGIPLAESAVALCKRALANDERGLKDAHDAVASRDALMRQRAEDTMPENVDDATITALRAKKSGNEGELAKIDKAIADEGSHQRKIKEASAHHAATETWSKIADDLSPDGLPALILAESIGPVSSRLAATSAMGDFGVTALTDDMAITFDGRPIVMCSESEQWRACTLLAEALSFVSGLKFLAIDRADVLSLPNRGALFAWLDRLTANGELDSAVVGATLKSCPTRVGSATSGFWIEAGALVTEEAAA